MLKLFKSRKAVTSETVVHDPFKRLIRQVAITALALFIVSVIPPGDVIETGFTADYYGDTSFVSDADLPPPAFLVNEEGFVLSMSPATKVGNRIGFTDSV